MKCASCRMSCYEDLNRIKPSSKIACRITKFLQFVHCLVFFQEHIVSELELFPCSGKSVGRMCRVCGRQIAVFAVIGPLSKYATMDKFRNQVILTTLIRN
jgi:hypothetical protein